MSIIPKKDATLNGSQKWKDTMKEFVQNNGISRAVPSEEQFRSLLCGQEAVWLGNSAEE